MPNTCIICYCQIYATDRLTSSGGGIGTEQFTSREGSKKLKRFFELVERYLGDGKEDGVAAMLFPMEDMIDSLLITCAGCSAIVESYCVLYHQMKTIELKLNWKLRTLTNIMTSGQRVPGRMQKFRDSFAGKQRDVKGKDWDNDNNLISKQTIDLFLDYKKGLVKKCKRKLNNSFPNLVVCKMRPEREERAISNSEEITETATMFAEGRGRDYGHALNNDRVEERAMDSATEDTLSIDDNEEPEPTHQPQQLVSTLDVTAKSVNETAGTTCRQRADSQCPKCRKTFSSAWRLSLHDKFHENYQQQKFQGGECREDEEVEDGSDYENDETFEPTQTLDEMKPDSFEPAVEPSKVSTNTKHSGNKSDEGENSEVDPELDLADIKEEPNEGNSGSESDSEMDYMEDFNESGEGLDDPSPSTTEIKRSNLKKGTTKQRKGCAAKFEWKDSLKQDRSRGQRISKGMKEDKRTSHANEGLKASKNEPESEDDSVDDKDDGSDYMEYSDLDSKEKNKSSRRRSEQKKKYDGDIEVEEPGSLKNCKSSQSVLPVTLRNPETCKFSCAFCYQNFESKHGCHRHLQAVHWGVRFKCRKCSASFTQKSKLVTHLKTKCGKQKLRKHHCEQCGKAYLTSTHLHRHVKQAHLRVRDCVCDICGKGFSRPDKLRTHVSNVHHRGNKNNYT